MPCPVHGEPVESRGEETLESAPGRVVTMIRSWCPKGHFVLREKEAG